MNVPQFSCFLHLAYARSTSKAHQPTRCAASATSGANQQRHPTQSVSTTQPSNYNRSLYLVLTSKYHFLNTVTSTKNEQKHRSHAPDCDSQNSDNVRRLPEQILERAEPTTRRALRASFCTGLNEHPLHKSTNFLSPTSCAVPQTQTFGTRTRIPVAFLVSFAAPFTLPMPQHCFPTSHAEANLLSTKILHRQRRLNTHEPIQDYEKRKAAHPSRRPSGEEGS